MAAITDLTFDQLATALDTDGALFIGEDPVGNISIMLSIAAINDDEAANDLAATGVIKLMTRLIEACRRAQIAVNESQVAGEMLDAFPGATSTGTVTDGYFQQTTSLKSKIAVSSATVIVGPTA